MERSVSETAALVDRLLSFSLLDGGLPYYRGNASAAEPTLLAATGASLQKAAPLLGISCRTIRYLIGKYDLNQVRKAEKRNGNGDRNSAL